MKDTNLFQHESTRLRIKNLTEEFDPFFHFDTSDLARAGHILFVVENDQEGSELFDQTEFANFFHKRSLGFTPAHEYALLLPCNSFKPEILCQTHFMTLRNLKSANLLGKVDVWVIAEPIGVYNYKYVFCFPIANYDFPPKKAGLRTKASMIRRIKHWYDVVGQQYREIICFLTRYYRLLVQESLSEESCNIRFVINHSRLHAFQEQTKLMKLLRLCTGE